MPRLKGYYIDKLVPSGKTKPAYKVERVFFTRQQEKAYQEALKTLLVWDNGKRYS